MKLMDLSCGLVGFPNVGKSTIFNVILKKALAMAENYPFCTIEPNTGHTPVPDSRLEKLAAISNSAKTVPPLLTCVDIAGLVKGAHEGQGLGNQFLGHIRQVSLIIQVLRCFDDDDIVHVEGSVDPVRDFDAINMELQFSDMAKLEKILTQKKGADQKSLAIAQKARDYLSEKFLLNSNSWSQEEFSFFTQQGLLTHKPMLVVANVKDNPKNNKYLKELKDKGIDAICISASTETMLLELENEDDRKTLLQEEGFQEDGLNSILQAAYKKLDLITFFTTGKQETRGWKIKNGINMQQAAGEIHTDFAKGFIAAEVVNYDDFITAGGWNEAKNAGLMKTASKATIAKDGDICIFRFNV